MYDYKKDKLIVIGKAMAKYGSKDDAIFEMNGYIADLKGQVDGKQALLDISSNAIKTAVNTLKSIDV